MLGWHTPEGSSGRGPYDKCQANILSMHLIAGLSQRFVVMLDSSDQEY